MKALLTVKSLADNGSPLLNQKNFSPLLFITKIAAAPRENSDRPSDPKGNHGGRASSNRLEMDQSKRWS